MDKTDILLQVIQWKTFHEVWPIVCLGGWVKCTQQTDLTLICGWRDPGFAWWIELWHGLAPFEIRFSYHDCNLLEQSTLLSANWTLYSIGDTVPNLVVNWTLHSIVDTISNVGVQSTTRSRGVMWYSGQRVIGCTTTHGQLKL